MTRDYKIGVIFLSAVAARIVFYLLTQFTADDAFITFRYAENLAAGLGMVYNAGEHVMGTTTPLFTALLAFGNLFAPPQSVALFISVAASGLTAVALYHLASDLLTVKWALIPTVAYVLWPRAIPAETSGMETALFTFFIVAALLFWNRRQMFYALGMATLSVVTRPEGGLLLMLLLVWCCWEDKERWLAFVSVPAVILVPWLSFSTYYFGSPIPHAIPAKLALYSQFGAGSWLDRLVQVMGWHYWPSWILTSLAIVGAIWLLRRERRHSLFVIWLMLMVAFFSFSNTVIFFWYSAPLQPVLLLLAAAIVPADAYLMRLNLNQMRIVQVAVVILVAAVSALGWFRAVPAYRSQQEVQTECHRAVGEYLSANVLAGQTVAAEDIGYIGYFSGLPIIDRDGLVSPGVVPYNERGDYYGVIRDLKPDWVVANTESPISGFVTDSVFIVHYQLRNEFGSSEVEYRVFKRFTEVSLDNVESSP